MATKYNICEGCDNTTSYGIIPVVNKILCKKCTEEYGYINMTNAILKYKIKKHECGQLKCYRTTNPVRRNAKSMKLYIITEIKSLITKRAQNKLKGIPHITEGTNISTYSKSNYQFTKEFTGEYQLINNKKVLVIRRHGTIVNCLKDLLEKRGHKVGNTKEIDIFNYSDQHGIQDIIEVKTNSKSKKQIYEGIGQLIFYSSQKKTQGEICEKGARLILALPKNHAYITFESILSSNFGIQILLYTWIKNDIKFINIDSIFPNIMS